MFIKYTTPLGIEQTDGKANLNPTLGYKNFGLTDATRIILGNQATGEGCTLLGPSMTPVEFKGDTTNSKYTIDLSYAYPGTVIKANSAAITGMTSGGEDAAADITVPAGVKLAEKTGLDLFGHKVKAWYDDRDTGNKTTYAILDKASLATNVHSLSAPNTPNPVLSGSGDNSFLGVAAKKAGFTVNLASSKAWISDRYSRIQGYNGGELPAAGDARYLQAYNSSPNGIYTLISNNDDKTVDVAISLSAEVAMIAQKDTTSTTKTVTLARPDATTNFATFASPALTNGVVNVKSLTPDSTQVLGDKVAAWQVIGTNSSAKYAAYADATGPMGSNTNMPFYQLDKLTKTVTGTVRTYGANKELTLTDGTVIEQSWFRDPDKVAGGTAATSTYPVPTTFEAGVTYTVALDNDGRWLGVVQQADQFLYATFADYEIGGLGTGTIGYAITGVNWNGEKVVNHVLTGLNLGGTNGTNGTVYPNANPNRSLADGYNALTITKKHLGAQSDTSGNEIQGGTNEGFVVTEAGVANNDATLVGATGSYAKLLNANGKEWVIDKDDVANGFADLESNGTLLATPNTKFIVVSGTGSATLDVKVYTGIGELLGNSTEVVLCADADATGAHGFNDKHNTYYLTVADRYNKWDTTSNNMLDTVIVTADDLHYSTPQNVFYAAPNAGGAARNATGVKLAGATAADVDQYMLWNNGELGYYFVDKNVATVGAGAIAPTGTATTGQFVTLAPAYTVNGTTVYKAVAVAAGRGGEDTIANGGICQKDKTYTYVSGTELTTAYIDSQVAKVDNAKVVDLDHTPASTWDEIKSVRDLADAISGGYGNIKVSYVNDGVNVSVIYVIDVAK